MEVIWYVPPFPSRYEFARLYRRGFNRNDYEVEKKMLKDLENKESKSK